MIRTVRSDEEERSAAARQAAAADLPLHGCPHITTSAMEDLETFRDKRGETIQPHINVAQ
jgi:hypothetical protein